MSLFSKPPGKKSAAPGGTPLTARQRALLEEEQRVKAEMERCTKFVENAPKLADKIHREQRDELLRRAATTHKSGRPASLIDRRSTLERLDTVIPPAQRRMRAERRQGRLMFFVLLLALAGAIFYLYYTVTHW